MMLAIVAAALWLAALTPGAAQETAAPLTPPTLLSPADDPDQEHCLTPDPQRGIELRWRNNEEPDSAGRPLGTYVEVRRGDPETGEWHPWVKKYAAPPFVLLVRPSVYDAVFAWRVWTVDRSGRTEPYATPSDWWLFCTEERAER
ncbi:MAG TPA: hypothetical protein VFK49_04355 [Stellaceae bacterium]|nr:hypothetical protein [Stellaceae bacterium]